MKRISVLVLLITVVAAAVMMLRNRQPPMVARIHNPTNRQSESSPDAELSAIRSAISRLDGDGTTVFIAISPDCPISTALIPELNRLTRNFGSQDVQFCGIIPGSVADADEAATHLAEFAVSFPVVYDRGNLLTAQLELTHTPQAVVLEDGRRVYSGRINNLFADIGKKRFAATEHDLETVLQAMQDHQNVPQQQTTPVGCLIPATPPNAAAGAPGGATSLTFHRDVAPVLHQHCAICHHAGEVAPFPLITFNDALQHADQIATVVRVQRMPPWKAEAGFGRFENEHRLTTTESQILIAWVNSQRLEGNPPDGPSPPKFDDDWYLGPPDLELILPEPFMVPAEGPDLYQHFVIPTGLTQDRLINAVDFRPGAPEVVHHSTIYYDTTGQGRILDAEQPGPGYNRIGSPGFPVTGSLGGWGPGGRPRRLPPGMGRPLERHADLIVQIHYHPNGGPARDQSRIGLYFAPPESSHAVTEIMVADVDLVIPAGATRHHHRAEYTLPVNTIVFDATPHMHVLGREIQAVAHLPDGRREPLIRIADWDFYWQDNYVYAQPLRLPKGTRIELDCWYDNSVSNPLNPHHPPQEVRWGDFSTDEMGICYFQATTETRDDYVTLNQHATDYFAELWQRYLTQRGQTDRVQR